MKISKLIIAFSAAAVLLAGSASAQEKATKKLTLGDPAPPLKYSKWIQGPKPITKIEEDRLYVIEFWATWCAPCIQAMPHLSELAKKYEGKIDFIGCDVWESAYGGSKDQESYLPKVTTFVNDQFKKGRLTYNVIADNTAEDMGNNWLKAAGQNGIPASFVIQKGKIAWIGHPHYLDSILVAIVDNKYDYRIEKAKKEAKEKKYAESMAGPTAAIKAYQEAETAKDYDKALKLVDEALTKYPATSYMFVADKFQMLLKAKGTEQAIAYGKELQKDKIGGQVLIGKLYAEDNLPKEIYVFAAEAVKSWNMQGNAKVFEILAALQAKAGLYAEAAASQEKAIEVAKEEKNNPAITEGLLKDYQEKVEKYKKLAAGKS